MISNSPGASWFNMSCFSPSLDSFPSWIKGINYSYWLVLFCGDWLIDWALGLTCTRQFYVVLSYSPRLINWMYLELFILSSEQNWVERIGISLILPWSSGTFVSEGRHWPTISISVPRVTLGFALGSEPCIGRVGGGWGGGARGISMYVCVCVCVCLFMCVLMHDACGSQGSILDAFFNCSPPNYPLPPKFHYWEGRERKIPRLTGQPPSLSSQPQASELLSFFFLRCLRNNSRGYPWFSARTPKQADTCSSFSILLFHNMFERYPVNLPPSSRVIHCGNLVK